jgi:uncharacterized protein
MQFTAQLDGTLNYVRAYSPTEVVIGERVLRSSVIVAPRELIVDWAPRSVDELGVAELAPVLALTPEVVLLGTGGRQVFPDARILAAAARAGAGLEVMDTLAACRTYNVLVQEGRRVVAALIVAGGESPG